MVYQCRPLPVRVKRVDNVAVLHVGDAVAHDST